MGVGGSLSGVSGTRDPPLWCCYPPARRWCAATRARHPRWWSIGRGERRPPLPPLRHTVLPLVGPRGDKRFARRPLLPPRSPPFPVPPPPPLIPHSRTRSFVAAPVPFFASPAPLPPLIPPPARPPCGPPPCRRPRGGAVTRFARSSESLALEHLALSQANAPGRQLVGGGAARSHSTPPPVPTTATTSSLRVGHVRVDANHARSARASRHEADACPSVILFTTPSYTLAVDVALRLAPPGGC